MNKSMIYKRNVYMSRDSKDVEEMFSEILNNYEEKEETIKYLREENKRIKDEKYKDSELTSMKRELEGVKGDLYRGFPISIKEKKTIEEWRLKHEAEAHGRKTLEQRLSAHGAIGGSYTYVFTPTSIGVVGEVKCSCGETFTFQDL